MDKDRVEGSVKQAKAKAKEVAGKVMGYSKLKAKERPIRLLARCRTRSAALRTPFGANSCLKIFDRTRARTGSYSFF